MIYKGSDSKITVVPAGPEGTLELIVSNSGEYCGFITKSSDTARAIAQELTEWADEVDGNE